ncbi:MAG: hypothetical protein M1827_007524 [Pycnora praestabilis]|nr:MAG: hypothetical protein M1827_007524 [Pycnora praestabilis]
MASTTKVTAACQCRSTSHTIIIPNNSLPLTTHLCHCATSRHVSGVLCTSYVIIPTPPHDLTELTAYNTSEALTRYFCTHCGTHMFAYHKPSDTWKAATGILDKSEGIVRVESNMWIGDTKDGGLADFLPSIGGRILKRWKGQAEQSEQFPPPTKIKGPPNMPQHGKVNARCHCGGVTLYIMPLSEASSKPHAAYPELLVEPDSPLSHNPEDEKWWLRHHLDTGRYLAGICACNDCRVATGFDIQNWTYVPEVNIFQQDGRPVDYTAGTLKQYSSAPRVYRNFCGKCGATVFWRSDDRPELIDVSTGLLEAESGARAEEILEWYTGAVSYEELALNKELIGGLFGGRRTNSYVKWRKEESEKQGKNKQEI